MMYDAAVLARGWLSVALASAKDNDRPVLDRTVHIEQHPGGLRLVATDSYMLLHTFVPGIDHELDPAPGIDEVPISSATARDPYGRARGFLAHVLRLASGEDADPIEIRVRLNVIAEATAQASFAGMEAHHVVVEQPDVERLVLDVVDGPYPVWRPLLADVHPVPTERVALSPDIVGRLARVAKVQPLARIGWTFAGEQKAARVDLIDSDPYVDGIVMPCRWDFDRNAPADYAEVLADRDDELDGQTRIDDEPVGV